MYDIAPSKAAAATATSNSDGALDTTLRLVTAALTTPAYGVVDLQTDFGFVAIALGNRVWLDRSVVLFALRCSLTSALDA